MTLVNKTLSQMLDEIGFISFVSYDILIPGENPELFQEVVLNKGVHIEPVQIPNDDYLKSICCLMCSDETRINNLMIIVKEIFYNSFEWGNESELYFPISVKLFDGSNGSVLRIRDSGKGFDFKKVAKNTREFKPKYFGDRGFWNFAKRGYSISFEGDGSILNLEVLNN